MDLKEKLFLVATVVAWLLSLGFLQQTYLVILERQEKYPDYPRFQDFTEALFYLVFLVAAREILSKFVFYKVGDHLISKSSSDRSERVDRFGVVMFKFVYFACASAYGLWLLSSEPWFPRGMGGEGSLEALWEGIPNQPSTPGIKFYYMISMAYHLHSLVYHAFIIPKRNDYLEMLTHHFLAIFLIVFSYMLNYLRFGSLVLIVHDLPDIPSYAVKAAVVTPYTKTALSIYACLLVVWGYARLYVLPVDIITATVADETLQYAGNDHGKYVLTVMLIGLFAMHCYWYVLFLFMGFRYLKIGKAEDIQQKLGDKKDDAEKVNARADILKQRKGNQTPSLYGVSNGNGHHAVNGNGNGVSNGTK